VTDTTATRQDDAERDLDHDDAPRTGDAGFAGRLRRLPWELPVAIIAQLLFLAHAVKTYFVDDDLINRATSGALANGGITYWTGVHQLIDQWWHDQGRFYPISFYQGPPQMMLLHDYRAYKVLLLGWTVVAGVCVWLLLREIGLGRAAASLALLLASVAVQFRPQDGILAYTGLEQIILAEMALSLFFFNKFLRLGRNRYMALSVLLFVISSLTYETSYVFGPLYAILALNARGWKLWPWSRLWHVVKPLLPIVAFSLVFIAIGSYGRAHAYAGDHGPYAPSWNKHEIFYTLVDQVIAAVPLTYAWLDPTGEYGKSFSTAIVHGLSWQDVAIGIVFAVVAFVLARRVRLRESWNPWVVALLGAALWVLTAFPIALATRYQAEIVGGLAHIPVVIEFFAFGMVAIGLAVGLGRLVPAPARTAGVAVLAVLIGVVAAFGHRANAITVANNLPSRTVGTTAELAASTLVRDHVANGSTVYVDPGDGANTANFYRQYSGKKLTVLPADPAGSAKVAKTAKPCTPGRPATWYLHEALMTNRTGSAVLTCQGGPGAWIVLRDQRTDRAAVLAVGHPTDPKHAPDGVFGLISDIDLNQVPGGVDGYSVAVTPVGAKAVMAEWTRGCWAAEGTAAGVGRYCERSGEITVFPTAGKAAHANLQIGVLGAGKGADMFVVKGPGVDKRFPVGASKPFGVDVPAEGLKLHVSVTGAQRMLEANGRDARILLAPAILVN
jgi:hypothetical protein